jgi:tetratricopeptide (TPR) repeat protein
MTTLLFAAPAFAQDVVQLNEQGITAFAEGRFEEAAQKFHQAYDKAPEPGAKKNEALAWFKAGKCSEALAAAKEYLALNVPDELSTKEAQTVAARCYIQRAEGEFASGNLVGTEAALADAKANNPAPEEVAKITKIEGDVAAKRKAEDAEKTRVAAAAAAAEEERKQQEARDAQSGNQMVGLGIAAGGGAIVLGTLVYHLSMALGTAPKFKDAAFEGDRAQYDKLGKKLETANWLIPTLYGVGLATVGVGGYFWWSAGGMESDSQQAAFLPRGVESAGVTLTWSFR